MSSINNNKDLNNYFINNKDIITLENYNNNISPTTTTTLENTIINYNSNIKALFCFNCRINLTKSNYINHLKKRHSIIYKDYKNNNKLNSLLNKVNSLDFYDIDEINTELGYNKYYFRELPIIFNNYKCRECLYINIDRKNIRIHFNKNHDNNNKSSKKEADYIISNIPLQFLEGFKYNTKIYFIPKLLNPNLLEANINLESLNIRSSRRSSSTSLDSLESNTSSSSSNSIITTDTRIINNNSRDLVINRYNLDINNKDNNLLDINTLEGNKRLLSSYITKSNIIYYLDNKNRDLLVNLAYRTKNNIDNNSEPIDLEDEIPIEFNILDKLVFNYLDFISSKINNINLLLRQRIKSSTNNPNIREFKDFIPLENKGSRVTYFTIFSNLLIFTIKVFYIKSKFKDSISREEKEYYNLVKDINLSSNITNTLVEIIKVELEDLESDESIIEFNYLLSRFYLELLKDTYNLSINTNNTLNNLTIIFFYINNLDKYTLEIRPILDISKLTSIIIYNARLSTIGYFYYLEISDDLNSDSLDNNIEDFINKYLNNNSKNYFEFISTLRPYLLALSKEVNSNKFIIVESKLDIIEANNTEYPISKIKSLFTDILRKLELILLNNLLYINNLDELDIDFNSLPDTTLLNKVGDNLIDLDYFKDLKKVPYFLDRIITLGTPYNTKLLKGLKDNKLIFKSNKIEKYNRDINRFLEYLTLAILLFSGGPLRAPELTTIIYKNIESKNRSLLYNKDNNLFTITTDYYKSKNITRKEKLNIRYIPPILSKILLVYIIYIIPFKEYILKEYYNLEDYNTPYLLVKDNKLLTSYNITTILKKESSLYFNKGLTLYSYRKIINYIIKTKFNNKDYFSSSDTNISDNIEDRQANRSTKTSFNYYFNTGSYFSNLNNIYNLNKIKEFSILYFNYFNLLESRDISNSRDISKAIIDTNIEDTPNYNSSSNNNLEFTINTKDLENNIRLL